MEESAPEEAPASSAASPLAPNLARPADRLDEGDDSDVELGAKFVIASTDLGRIRTIHLARGCWRAASLACRSSCSPSPSMRRRRRPARCRGRVRRQDPGLHVLSMGVVGRVSVGLIIKVIHQERDDLATCRGGLRPRLEGDSSPRPESGFFWLTCDVSGWGAMAFTPDQVVQVLASAG